VFAVPTQYDLTNEDFATVAATNAGPPNPICIPHLGVRLTRPEKSGDAEHDEENAEPRPGRTVDACSYNVSSRVQTGGAWTTRHNRFLCCIALLMQMHGIRVRVEPEPRTLYTTTLRTVNRAWWNSSYTYTT
jgi:hypothetical protein